MNSIFTARYNYDNPSQLQHILKFIQIFEKYIAYAEVSRTGQKHIHIRIETDYTPKTIGEKKKLLCPFLIGARNGHHWVSRYNKGIQTICTSESHNPPNKPKPCAEYGSFTYNGKDLALILNKGYEEEFIEKMSLIGNKIKETTKLPLYKKIIKYSNLHVHSSPCDIRTGITAYWARFRETHVSQYQSFRSRDLVHNILMELFPTYQQAHNAKFEESIRQMKYNCQY